MFLTLRTGELTLVPFPPAGLGIPRLLEAILKLLPLDSYVPSPVGDGDTMKLR